MFVNIPYTYVIGWSKLDKWYYGVRYSKKCNPNDLFVTYFTSSDIVKKYIIEYGLPDVVFVRKTFSDPNKAKRWENTVLRRCKVIHDDKWLNKTMSYSFPTRDIRGDKNPMKNPEVRKRVSEKLKNRVPVKRITETVEVVCVICGFSEVKRNTVKNTQNKTCSKSCSTVLINNNRYRNGFTLKGRKHKNRGTTFLITDGISTKRIKIGDPIPDGWKKGRHYDPKA